MDPHPMDWVRLALFEAEAAELTLEDLQHAAQHAQTCEAFGDAVAELAHISPAYECIQAVYAAALMYPK